MCSKKVHFFKPTSWGIVVLQSSIPLGIWWGVYLVENSTLPQTNIAPENGPPWKRRNIYKPPILGFYLSLLKIPSVPCLRTNIFPIPKVLLKIMIFLFLFGGICDSSLDDGFLCYFFFSRLFIKNGGLEEWNLNIFIHSAHLGFCWWALFVDEFHPSKAPSKRFLLLFLNMGGGRSGILRPSCLSRDDEDFVGKLEVF